MLEFLVDARPGTAQRVQWNQAMREVYGPRWSLNPARPEDFHMSLQAVQIGSLTLSRASLSQAEVSTGRELNRRTRARSYNIFIADRTQHLRLAGQPLVLQPGDFTLADSALTSTVTTHEPYTTIGLTVPPDFLRTYVPHPERVIGMRFAGSAGISRVISLMLQDMWQVAEGGTLPTVGNRLAVSLFEAFSACCELAQTREPHATSTAAARRAQIRDAIETHLRDPDFSAGALARGLDLSPRYVRMLFNDDEESISQYIRRRRLEGCRRELADREWRDHSIAAIAQRWGFGNAAHFCRAFQAQYGTSPGRFRQHAFRCNSVS